MRFLHFLEGLRNPVCDFLFSLITHIGEETVFLAVAILFFWCINKREGYYILITGLIGTLVNQFLKMLCRIPRPWERGTGLTYVESAFEEAKGYSFPSGHTQNTAGTFGVIGAYSKKKMAENHHDCDNRTRWFFAYVSRCSYSRGRPCLTCGCRGAGCRLLSALYR